MRLLIAALSALLGFAPFANGADMGRIVSGAYSSMLVGFDPATRTVTGYFSDSTGRGQFSCIFYMTGVLQGSEVPVSTYFPETPTEDLIKGRMVLTARGKFSVRLTSEHGGCWNVEHFADKDEPAEFSLDAAYPWTSVAVIKLHRSYFFDSPESLDHRKGYLVKGDGVGVRAAKPGWLEVDYVGAGKRISGWIKQADVYSAQ